MNIINAMAGIAFLGAAVGGPIGGYLVLGPITYDNAASHLSLSCRMGAMNWLPNTESTQLLTHDCRCFGAEMVKRLEPSARLSETETMRNFMLKATIEGYRNTPYEQIMSMPETKALYQSPIADLRLLDWVSDACLTADNS